MEEFPLPQMDITRLPTFPAPWLSSDEGEVFSCGDYLLVLQKKPPTLVEHVQRMEKRRTPEKTGIFYLYALIVYHKIYEIGQEGMFKPIMAITLEQSDQTELLKYIEDEDLKNEILKNDCISDPMLCMFTIKGHANFGIYHGSTEKDAVLETFFKKFREFFPSAPKIESVGSISEVMAMLRADKMQ